MSEHFFDRLCQAIEKKKSVGVVGLDPRLEYVPAQIRANRSDAEAVLEYNLRIIETIAPLVPAVKLQVACYECFGIAGMKTYSETLKAARRAGLLAIGDIKRGDIDSTAAAYAQAHLSPGADFEADAVTLNPYLGSDSLKPFMESAKKFGKGLFILVKTSNPSSSELQDLESGGEKIYEKMAALVNKTGADSVGARGFALAGSVVGGTFPEIGIRLRKNFPGMFFLIPGYGAQGATAKDLVGYFRADKLGAVVNSSRGIIAAHVKSADQSKWLDDVLAATRKMNADLNDALGGMATPNQGGATHDIGGK